MGQHVKDERDRDETQGGRLRSVEEIEQAARPGWTERERDLEDRDAEARRARGDVDEVDDQAATAAAAGSAAKPTG